MASTKVIVAFVPVLHEGYRQFLEKHGDAKSLFIFSTELIKGEFPYLQKEIRALRPEVMATVLKSSGIFENVEVVDQKRLKALSKENFQIISPDEDVSRELAEKYFKNKKITFDKVFLRWDKHKSMEEKPVEADQKISRKEFDRKVIQKLKVEAEKSSDWWRRIASAILKDGKLIMVAHNKHMPSEHSPYTLGDPRNNFHKGVGIETSTAIHSEAALISEAARIGEKLEGASMYVTVFPCSPCAKLIANAGIKKLYYSGGYTLLDQDKLLQHSGVEIIYVEA
jgi:dCMP deaminase